MSQLLWVEWPEACVKVFPEFFTVLCGGIVNDIKISELTFQTHSFGIVCTDSMCF